MEEVVVSWLVDPSWQKVFKHTFDVIKDYVTYSLVATGMVSLSVRLLTTLSSGDLVCIIIGRKNKAQIQVEIDRVIGINKTFDFFSDD